MNAIPANDPVKYALSDARQNDRAVIARREELMKRETHGQAPAPAAAPATTATPTPAASAAPATPASTAAPASTTIHPLGLAFLKPEHVAKLDNPYARLTGYVSNEYMAEFNKMTSGEAKTDGRLKSAEELAAFMGTKDVALAGKVFKALDKDGKNGVSLKELAPMLADGDIAGNHDGKASAAELTESAQYIVKNGGGKLPPLWKTYNPVPPAPPAPTAPSEPAYHSNSSYEESAADRQQRTLDSMGATRASNGNGFVDNVGNYYPNTYNPNGYRAPNGNGFVDKEGNYYPGTYNPSRNNSHQKNDWLNNMRKFFTGK